MPCCDQDLLLPRSPLLTATKHFHLPSLIAVALSPGFLSPTRYCSKCQAHQAATKTLAVWRLPEYLIVHLKRFSWKNVLWRNKLDFLLDYPIEGLDLSDHVVGPDASPADCVYDLFATIDHYGKIWGGHYTARAKHEGGQV